MKTLNDYKTVLGPLFKLVSDKGVFEVVIDSKDEIHYSTREGIKKASKLFKTEAEFQKFVSGLIKVSGNKTQQMKYYVSLTDHVKVNIVLPPVSVKGPAINIMKLPEQDLNLDDLQKFDAIDEKGKKLLQEALANHKSVLVAGNMGSGKTTLLNMLIKSLPEPYRVVTLERFPDLIINKPMTARLQTVNQTPEEMLDLVRIAERMRPDCLVISELVGPEVMPYLDFLRSNCTGLGLITAQSAVDAMKRLETKALLSSEGLSLEDVRYAIAQSFNLIVFQERLPDGKRKVTNISEISYDSGDLKLNVLYKIPSGPSAAGKK